MTQTLSAPPQKTRHSTHEADRRTIASCLTRIRTRLYTARLTERMALAVAWGAGVGLLPTAARLLRDRYPAWAVAAAAAGLPAAAWLWVRAGRFGRGVLTPDQVRGGAALTAAVAAAAGAVALLPAGGAVPVWAMPAGTVALFAAAAVAVTRPVSPRAAAIFVDAQAGLDERVSTALELLDAPPPAEQAALEAAFRAPVVDAAVAACQEVKGAKVGYWRLGRHVYAAAVTLALAAGGLALLQPLPPAKAAVRKPISIAEPAKRLEQVLQEIEQKKLPAEQAAAEKMQAIQKALQDLKQGDMKDAGTQALLNEAKDALKRDRDARNGADEVQQALRDLEQTKDFARAADPLKEAAMQNAAGDPAAAAQQQAAKDGVNKAAQALADKMKGGMSDGEKKELAENLQKAADRAGAAGDQQLQRDLTAAAGAAQNGNADDMAKALQAAGDRMGQQQASRALSQQAVNRAMDEIDRMQGSGLSAAEQAAEAARQNGGGQSGGDQQGQQANGGRGGQDGQQGPSGDQNGGQNGPQGSQAAGGQSGAQGEGGGQNLGGSSASAGQSESGSGSTNFRDHGGPGDKHEGGAIGRESAFASIYDQRQIETRGNQEKLPGQVNPNGGPAAGSKEVLGQADDKQLAFRTYTNELPGARQRAMDDLNKQEIPPQYQEMIKTFYDK
jgi:hypothetical protein